MQKEEPFIIEGSSFLLTNTREGKNREKRKHRKNYYTFELEEDEAKKNCLMTDNRQRTDESLLLRNGFEEVCKAWLREKKS